MILSMHDETERLCVESKREGERERMKMERQEGKRQRDREFIA